MFKPNNRPYIIKTLPKSILDGERLGGAYHVRPHAILRSLNCLLTLILTLSVRAQVKSENPIIMQIYTRTLAIIANKQQSSFSHEPRQGFRQETQSLDLRKTDYTLFDCLLYQLMFADVCLFDLVRAAHRKCSITTNNGDGEMFIIIRVITITAIK